MSNTPDTTSTSLPRPILFPGIFGREIHATRNIWLTAIILTPLLPLISPVYDTLFEQKAFIIPEAILFMYVWEVIGFLMAYILGVLSGAEEEENGTMEFVRGLPIPAWRIWAAKIGGSLTAFTIWAVGSILLIEGLLIISGQGVGFFVKDILFAQGSGMDNLQMLCWWSLLFGVSVGIGVWTRHVLLTAVAASVAVASFFVVLTKTFEQLGILPANDAWSWLIAIGGMGLLAALVRYQWRFISPRALWYAWSNRSNKTHGLLWKEWREGLPAFALILPILLLGPISNFLFYGSLPWPSGKMVDYASLLSPLYVCAVLIGGRYFSKIEIDPVNCFLETLPISGKRVWCIKLSLLIILWLILSVLWIAINFGPAWHQGKFIPLGTFSNIDNVIDTNTFINVYDNKFLFVLGLWLCSLPLTLFSAVVRLHTRSRLVHFAITFCFSIPMMAFLLFPLSFGLNTQNDSSVGIIYPEFIRIIAMAGMLALWLGFLQTRTMIRAKSGIYRLLTLVLFAVGIVEFGILVLRCDYRDLLFLILGI